MARRLPAAQSRGPLEEYCARFDDLFRDGALSNSASLVRARAGFPLRCQPPLKDVRSATHHPDNPLYVVSG